MCSRCKENVKNTFTGDVMHIGNKQYCADCTKDLFRRYDLDDAECEYCGCKIETEGYWKVYGDVICDSCFEEEFIEKGE